MAGLFPNGTELSKSVVNELQLPLGGIFSAWFQNPHKLHVISQIIPASLPIVV